jgi:hypothetical protein
MGVIMGISHWGQVYFISISSFPATQLAHEILLLSDTPKVYRKLYKQSNAAQPDGSMLGVACNSFPYFTAISKKNLA